ncbi:pentapeptide repeat-containing protein [Actinopolyspora lacussalsi]|uniref:pentapeptide repeat-containing protein n=1 Tax=Actinopolyspora righensis TaxID=995060 RepID=UPI001C315AA9|nr:pentapeptide repeat-containing protein [Actinopolyspora righensis]
MARSQPTPEVPRVLSNRAITIGAVVVVGITLLSTTLLVVVLRDAPPKVILEAVRTSASIGVGTGGAAALWLAARRQRSTEVSILRRDHDATETRVTELYGRAAEQLSADKAPVRLAGIFALERLGQTYPTHRQTIVDLICAYLRMSPEAPDEQSSPEHGGPQEFEVRQAAQQVLVTHLRLDEEPAEDSLFWPDIALNLSGAVLHTFTFSRCRVRSATFADASFHGPAVFRGTLFERQADFRGVRFSGLGDFRRVGFEGEGVTFRGATFAGEVDFGTHTTAALTGAMTRLDDDTRRKWPADWTERPLPDEPGWAELVARRG